MKKNSGTTKLIMPTFGPGMLLQHDDLELLGNYPRELSRLLFKSFFGCGVICGLKVKAETDCGKIKIDVERGVALTCSGDPIPVSAPLEYYADIPGDEKSFWIVLCRDTKRVGSRTTMCDTDSESSAAMCTREIDTYELKVKNQLTDECGCTKPKSAGGTAAATGNPHGNTAANEDRCHEEHNAGNCGCNCNCSDGGNCVVLAEVVYRKDPPKGEDEWMADHRARRFIRPVMLPDLKAEEDGEKLGPPSPNTSPAQSPPATKIELQQLNRQLQEKIDDQDVQQRRIKDQIEQWQTQQQAELKSIRFQLEEFQMRTVADAGDANAEPAKKTARNRNAATGKTAKKTGAVEAKPGDNVVVPGDAGVE